MWKSVFAICVGASLGALFRWWLGAQLNSLFPTIPPGALAANLVGGYIVGVAIAVLLVADEPTGNLDSANGARVLALLEELNAELGVAILLATHADEVAASAHRIVHMHDGRIVREERTQA